MEKNVLRSLDAAALAIATVVSAMVLWAWAMRWLYPYDLEWMEGGMMGHAWRLANGQPLFVAPSPEFTPFIYPPGYPALVAGLSWGDMPSLAVGRALSIAGTFLAAAAIVALVRRHGRSLTMGLVAGACFLGCYRASGAFYDIVRADGVGMGLFAWSVFFAAERRKGSEIASGLLLAAAAACKHNFAAFGVPILVALLLRGSWRSAARFVASSALPAMFIYGMIQVASEGRALTYLLVVPQGHPVRWERILPGIPIEVSGWLLGAGLIVGVGVMADVFWRHWDGGADERNQWLYPALGASAALAVVTHGLPLPKGTPDAMHLDGLLLGLAIWGSMFAVIVAAGRATRSGHWRWRWWLAAGVGATALFFSAWMRGHAGGYINVLMPLQWALCAGAGLAVGQFRTSASPIASVLATAALCVQTAWIAGHLEVSNIVPTDEDLAAGDEVVAAIKGCPKGQVLVPHAAWLPVYAGRDPSPHLMAWWDLNHKKGPFKPDLKSIHTASEDQSWACAILNRQSVGYGVERGYTQSRDFDWEERELMPKTGFQVRPERMLRRKASD